MISNVTILLIQTYYSVYVIVMRPMMEIHIIIIWHVILQHVVTQDVINMILISFVLKLIMIISINKEKTKKTMSELVFVC